jgi:hypothetical protein
MVSNADYAFDKLSLDELMDLLVKKTTVYIKLKDHKDANATRLRDLKLQLEKLHSVITHRKSSNWNSVQKRYVR